MTRLGSFLILTLSLTACVTLTPRPNSADQGPAAHAPGGSMEAIGRVGPNGAPPAPPVATVDRGIGGTGAPVSLAPAITADRGIGGTGIVGVVTGFGSVFVDGIEVAYDNSATVDIDGGVSSVSALRAGQLVVVQADGSVASPYAKTISVRTAVAGRIDALERGSGTLTVAGQTVAVPEGTWGANQFGMGDWVRVSGLRRDDGTIVASRLDTAPAGGLLARGQVGRDDSGVRVGNLPLSGAVAASVKDGQYVVVTGGYAAGHGQVSAVAADPLWPNPAAYFGAATNRLFVQAFVRVDKGSVSINGVPIKSAPAITGQDNENGLAIVSLLRQPDGSYTAVGLRYGDYEGRTSQPTAQGSGTGAGDPAPRFAAAALPQPSVSQAALVITSPVTTAASTSDPNAAPASDGSVDATATAPIVARAVAALSSGTAPADSAAGSAFPMPGSVDGVPIVISSDGQNEMASRNGDFPRPCRRSCDPPPGRPPAVPKSPRRQSPLARPPCQPAARPPPRPAPRSRRTGPAAKA